MNKTEMKMEQMLRQTAVLLEVYRVMGGTSEEGIKVFRLCQRLMEIRNSFSDKDVSLEVLAESVDALLREELPELKSKAGAELAAS